MPSRSFPLFLALLLLLLAACGADPEPGVDPTAIPTPAPADTTVAAPPAADTVSDEAGQALRPEEADPPDAPAGTSSSSPGGTLAGTFEGTAGVTDVPANGTGAALLRAVRSGRHEHFDRVVFEFESAVPGYHVEYVDRPVRRCGSGDPVEVAGDGWLEVRMSPADAHTEAGEPTVRNRERTVSHPVLKELQSTCDFEAVVTWVLGVASPNRYRVQTLSDPPRLVVDVRH